MKKKVLLQSMLILLPILAVGLATTADSVTVFDTVNKQVSYYSYFDIIPDVELQILTPLAAISSAVSGILAALYLAKKKPGMLNVAGSAAMAAACLAAIPVIMRTQILVVPNAGLPVFMVLQYICCVLLRKMNAEIPREPVKARRLPRR